VSEWTSPERALAYLSRAGEVPHRAKGEAVLLEMLPAGVSRVLDLGAGDGRLLGVVGREHPSASGVALDFSPTMLQRARERFGGEGQVWVVEHDLEEPLPGEALGTFDAVVSSIAIHHLEDGRKRALYEEVFALLEPGGAFLNLNRVASPTPALRRRFLVAMGHDPYDDAPSDRPLDVETQLRWLREIGFADVDCHWKWLELALLGGVKSAG
jgi:tRNA (cmo5U34)-methyltransferase